MFDGFDERLVDVAADVRIHCVVAGAPWRKRCSNLRTGTLPGGHFFVDQFPGETAAILSEFLGS